MEKAQQTHRDYFVPFFSRSSWLKYLATFAIKKHLCGWRDVSGIKGKAHNQKNKKHPCNYKVFLIPLSMNYFPQGLSDFLSSDILRFQQIFYFHFTAHHADHQKLEFNLIIKCLLIYSSYIDDLNTILTKLLLVLCHATSVLTDIYFLKNVTLWFYF